MCKGSRVKMNNTYNKPYLWKQDPKVPQKCHAYYNQKERKTNRHIFTSGEYLPKPDVGQIHYSQNPQTYDLVFDIQAEEECVSQYDCLPNNTAVPLVSMRVLDILKSLCPNDFQFFPALIRSQENKLTIPYVIENEYWVINIIGTVEAFDKELSVFDKLPENLGGQAIGLRHMVLNSKDVLGSHLLARDKKVESQIIVSPLIKEAFKKAKIKGSRFVTDEEYNRNYFYK